MPEEERVVVTMDAPAWLPAGSTAQVLRSVDPPRPMSLVRLLLRRGDTVFCVPRQDSGKLDLPTRATDQGDADGSEAVRVLAEAVTGSSQHPVFLGAVRNVVPFAPQSYVWPTPLAHFGVWSMDAAPHIAGRWISIRPDGSPLRDRHWFPLVTQNAERRPSAR